MPDYIQLYMEQAQLQHTPNCPPEFMGFGRTLPQTFSTILGAQTNLGTTFMGKVDLIDIYIQVGIHH